MKKPLSALASTTGAMLLFGLLTLVPCFARAAVFQIPKEDVAGLKAALAAANSNGEADTINLFPGGTYQLAGTDNSGSAGPNALPVVAADGGHALTINGNGAVIVSAADCRVLQIAPGAIVTLNGLTLTRGRSSQRGGAILNENGALELFECTLSYNAVFAAPVAQGGAIYNANGRVTLRRCAVVGNTAEASSAPSPSTAVPKAEGGGIYNAGGTVQVQLCTFSNNGLFASGSTGTAGGAAIANAGPTGRLLITNSTFAANGLSAVVVTSGRVISSSTDGAAAEIGSSIVVGGAPVFSGQIVSRGYNLTNGDGAGMVVSTGDQLNTDPQLGPLASNGGPTQTHPIGPASPAVDKGKSDAIASLAVATDQRGLARPFDYPGVGAANGGDTSDIGAYELGLPQNGTTLTVTSIDDHDNGHCSTDDCTLREAIAAANALAGNNTIVFAPDVTGTIQLRAALPNLSTNIMIEGGDARLLAVRRDPTISGPGSLGIYRIFTIGNGTTTGPIVSLQGLTVTNGQGSGSPANGGGIYNDHGSLRIERCWITGNTATNGAGVFGLGGSITVVDSTIDDNDATGFGGGFFNSAVGGNAALNMSNVTLTDNSGSRGGAIYNAGPSGAATVTLQNATVSVNFSSQGTIYIDGATSKVSLRNTILSPAAGGASFVKVNGGSVTSFGYNISSDAAGGDSGTGPGGSLAHATDRRNTDPKFRDSLTYSGGGTPTIPLRFDSPAVNAGEQNSAPTRDQRGFVRAGTADIGAFEFGGTLPVTLANLSTRLRVETGNDVLIGGFIVTGSKPKRLILRAIGPSLPVAGALADPQLEIYNAAGQRIALNNDWRTNQESEIMATTVAPPNNLEAAFTGPFDPGAYTAVVSGANGGTGVALVEVYDLDRTVDSRLANISTRGRVRTGDDVMIAGFIVVGPDQQELIVRAIGPSLPLDGALANPMLELFNGNGARLAANDDWRSDQETAITATGIAPAHDSEAAIVRRVAPGAYTAIVRGVGNTTGIAVVEVYALN